VSVISSPPLPPPPPPFSFYEDRLREKIALEQKNVRHHASAFSAYLFLSFFPLLSLFFERMVAASE